MSSVFFYSKLHSRTDLTKAVTYRSEGLEILDNNRSEYLSTLGLWIIIIVQFTKVVTCIGEGFCAVLSI